MVERHITERMTAALGQLALRYPKRRGKAFYLGPDDWADFIATDPPMIDTLWNCLPAYEYSFGGIPVRASKNVAPRASRLYDNTACGRDLDAAIKPDGRMIQTKRQRAALALARTRRRGTADRTPEAWLALLGDGGFMTWASSPHVMWLASGCPIPRVWTQQKGAAEATPSFQPAN